jgi:hypothetical protein
MELMLLDMVESKFNSDFKLVVLIVLLKIATAIINMNIVEIIPKIFFPIIFI